MAQRTNMNRILFAVGVLAASMMPGCAVLNKSMASWVGHDSNELIAAWGPPQQVLDAGQGGQIFVYSYNRQWTSPGTAYTTGSATVSGNYVYGQATTTYQPPQTHGYAAQRMFWIDRNRRVYRWSWSGL